MVVATALSPPPSRPALVFVAELARRGSFATTAGADRPLRVAWCRARAVYPWVEAPITAFAGWLADRVDITDPLGSLSQLEVSDLYLACALSHHDPGALRHLDDIVGRIEAALEEAAALAPFAADVGRWLRAHLLVDEESPAMQRLRGPFVEPRPGVVRYGGDRPLADWIQSLAIRRALSLHRARAERNCALDGAQRRTPSPSIPVNTPLLRRPSQASSGGVKKSSR